MLSTFKNVFVIDFEFVSNPGEKPLPVCLVSHEIYSGETQQIWLEGEDSIQLPYPMGDLDLFVAYYSSAEWGCHYSLNWPLPANVIDLYAEFRVLTNGRPGISNRLLGACHFFGVNAISESEKEEARTRILQGPPYTDIEKEEILSYCASDVLETAELFKKMEPYIDVPRAMFRGQYMKTVAGMENYGIPIDRETLDRLRANWVLIKERLIQDIDRDYEVYEGTTFKIKNFEHFLDNNGMPWPRTEKGNLELSDGTFKEMTAIYPQLQSLRDLRYILGQLRLLELPVGLDNRNRCLLSPFGTKTGRNSPSSKNFIFGPAVWLRSLIKPEQGNVLAYLDYSQQEFLIAGALSNDFEMKETYKSGDPYLTFAKKAGAAPSDATKETHKEIRDCFKQCVLGVQYGMGKYSLAVKIGRQAPYASELLHHHRRVYKKYWNWCEHVLNSTLLLRRISTCYGWQLYITGQEEKGGVGTIKNFPCQATGAEILRVACILLMEHDIKIIAPVHDAILIECEEEGAAEVINQASKLMGDASEIVLGPGNRIRIEANIIKYPDRYSDPRGVDTWQRIMKILHEIES